MHVAACTRPLPPNNACSSFEKWILFSLLCVIALHHQGHVWLSVSIPFTYLKIIPNYNVKVIAHVAGVDTAPPPPSAPPSTMENMSYN